MDKMVKINKINMVIKKYNYNNIIHNNQIILITHLVKSKMKFKKCNRIYKIWKNNTKTKRQY